MGCVTSAPIVEGDIDKRVDLKKNKEIEDFIQEEQHEDQMVFKLLLLGAGESGKSTLFKQARALYGKAFSEQERTEFCNTIIDNIIQSLKILMENTRDEDMEDAIQHDKKFAESYECIRDIDHNDISFISEELGAKIDTFWKHPVIQSTFDRKSSFQVIDSVKYYCENIQRIANEHYIPTFQDVLMSRRTTMGVTESVFKFKNRYLKFVDVGGQRSQRSKWIKQFTDCHAVIFVAAISEYDQVLRENESTNRLLESNQLFNVICKTPELQNAGMILFLNKTDLFNEKLSKKIPLTICYPEYQSGFDYDKACAYIKSQFQKGCDRELYIHLTCATDQDNMKRVMTDLADLMLQDILSGIGMVR
jgi:GTPase SAR1 family protein